MKFSATDPFRSAEKGFYVDMLEPIEIEEVSRCGVAWGGVA